MILREAGGAEAGQLLVGIVSERVGVVFADAEALVAAIDVAELVVDGDGLDLLASAPGAEAADEEPAERAGAVVDDSVLVKVALARGALLGAADDGEQRAVARAGVERDAHAVAGGFPLEDGDAAAIDRRHVG